VSYPGSFSVPEMKTLNEVECLLLRMPSKKKKLDARIEGRTPCELAAAAKKKGGG
jgi:hypothetical protein